MLMIFAVFLKMGKTARAGVAVWLSGLRAGLQTKQLLVPFPIGAHARVAGTRKMRGNRSMVLLYIDVSLSLFLPSPFSTNK